jgi:hypothetical protein
MRTHGKFIAVGFVIALIATIYMAQNGDEPSPPQRIPSAQQAEAGKTPANGGPANTPSQAAAEALPLKERDASPSLLSEANPAAAANHGEPRAELQAPDSKNVIKEPTTASEVADSKSLFPWKDSADPRVASKPESPRAKQPAASQAPRSEYAPPAGNNAGDPPSIYGPAGSATEQNRVEAVNPRAEQPASLQQPAAGEGSQSNSPALYPVTHQSTFRDFGSPPAKNNSASSASATQPANPVSSQNPGSNQNPQQPRTSGPRYERTGSGLY